MERTQIAPMTMTNAYQYLPWIAWAIQLVVAAILAQTIFFKFTYAPETQYIFADRGGRPAATVVGIAELVCVVLLLIPRTASIGAALSLLVIGGALYTHLTSLGIQITNPATGESDDGLLFGLAVTVALGAVLILAIRWRELETFLPKALNFVVKANSDSCEDL